MAGVVPGPSTVLHLLSQNALMDTIYALGIMICFYYGLTAFACIWFFRRVVHDVKSFVFQLLFPCWADWAGSGPDHHAAGQRLPPTTAVARTHLRVGLVLILGVGLILLGFALMLGGARCRGSSSAARRCWDTPPSLTIDLGSSAVAAATLRRRRRID